MNDFTSAHELWNSFICRVRTVEQFLTMLSTFIMFIRKELLYNTVKIC